MLLRYVFVCVYVFCACVYMIIKWEHKVVLLFFLLTNATNTVTPRHIHSATPTLSLHKSITHSLAFMDFEIGTPYQIDLTFRICINILDGQMITSLVELGSSSATG